MNQSLGGRIARRLAQLYQDRTHDELDVLASRVVQAFQDAAGTPPQAERATAAFRSDEVMLITYGGTFTSPGQPHLRSLGQFWHEHLASVFTSMHVLPFFTSSSDGGFSVVDYRQVSDELGDWSELAQISADEMMFDLVCNHGSAGSQWFADFVADREPGRSFYVTADPGDDLSGVVRPRTHPLLLAVPTAGDTRHVWATFSHDQIDFDFANPDVLVEFCSILGFYVSQGATRIRLDAIAYLWKQLGTSCVHLPQTHEVVKLMRELTRSHDPSLLLITETNVPHKQNISYFGDLVESNDGDSFETDEAQVVYNFTLAPLIVWSVLTGRGDTLTNWLGQLSAPPSGCAFLNFLASHDGIGLRPVEDLISFDELEPLIDRAVEVGGGYSAYSAPGGPRPYELNVSLADLLAGIDGETAERFVVAHAVMLAVQGIPAIYVHSMLASPGDTQAVTRTGHKRDINRAQIDLDDAVARVTTGWRSTVFAQLSHLISQRRRHDAFGPESPQTMHVLHANVVAIERGTAHDRVFAVHNMSGAAVTVTIPDDFGLRDVISATTMPRTVTLAPWQAAWLC